ncbi:hypothetical protein THMIRHAT_23370 [Thiosulfativibrio zosterae]|uniref:GGDEF domain-containing protein n=2 Tax=Thiosulfativibrio zosterae TaxID=2675053 RepID=A0A6F8PR41_9GAMM|nr:hypothetical protein THMIRHAT_23370 [Thiosulfativibrio zosterae]
MVLVDFNTGNLVFLNQAAERLFGYTTEQVVGKSQQILHPPIMNQADKDTFIKHRQQLEKQGQVEGMENIALHADGSHTHVEINVNILEIAHQKLMVGVFTPIEKRVQAMRELRQHKDELQAIFNNSQVGIFNVDQNRIITRVNQRFLTIFGYDLEAEVLGRSVEVIHESHKSYLKFGLAYFSQLPQKNALHIEYPMRKKSGKLIWCRISGKAIHADANSIAEGATWVIDDISDRKATEHALELERNLFTGGPTTILQWQPVEGWPVVYASKNVTQNLGYTQEDLRAPDFRFSELIHDLDAERVGKEVSQYLAEQRDHFEQYYRIKTKSGSYRSFYDYTQVEYNELGEPINIYGYLIDMTAYLNAQEMNQLLLAHSTEGIMGIDSRGHTSFVNPAALKMLGYEQDELIDKANHELIHHSDGDGNHIHAQDCRMSLPLKTGENYHVTDEVLWRKDGSSFAIEYWSTPMLKNSEIIGSVVTFHDISKRLEQENKIKHLAYHDPLTGLPNRRQLMRNLHAEIQDENNLAQRASLMLLDIDHFKEVNDSLGHPIGDELLKGIVGRIQNIIRPADTFARIGGDEFAILIPHDLGGINALKIAERIIETFKTPFKIKNHHIKSNTSIGITLCNSGLKIDNIISQADIALYEAKNQGRGNFVFYELSMIDKVNDDLKLFNGLTQALNKQEFSLHYQLKFDAKNQQIDGAEMLLRWHPKDESLIKFSRPDIFIPMSEKRNYLQTIGLWQLEQLAKDIPLLKAAGLKGRISINLSGCQLSNVHKFERFIEVVLQLNMALTDLEFEITETAYANLSDTIKDALSKLQNQGLSIAIDDFGTGYSSLVALRELHSNILKIDKQFVDDLDTSEDDEAIVSAIIYMAHALGKAVVAEGVETEQQMLKLQTLGCDIYQGYYFARPQSCQDTCRHLQSLTQK